MVAGVTYPYFVLNAIVAAELFLLFKTPFALIPSLFLHALGYAAHLRDPHIMALWLTRLRRVPRVENYAMRGANVYCA